MKVIVLAAGKGERLKNIVYDIPKPMIKIRGKPILEHNIEWLESFGVRDIYINVHYLANVIRDYFGNGRRWGVKITYSWELELLGTAGAVRKITDDYWIKSLKGQRLRSKKGAEAGEAHTPYPLAHNPFLVVYGDNLLSDFDLNQIIGFHRRKGGIGTVCLYEKSRISQSGVAEVDSENKLVKFIEKPGPGETVSNLVNAGIYVLEPKILKYIPKNQFSDFGKDIFPRIIKERENMYGIVMEARLTAVDTPELLKKAMRWERNL